MITISRAEYRHHERHRNQEVWLTFRPGKVGRPFAGGFGALKGVREERLRPGAGAPRHQHNEVEIVTYVREGVIAYQDSLDRSGFIHAGEFQRMTAGSGIRHRETNPSRTHWAHVFQILLRPSAAGLEPSHEQKRFSAAERRSGLCLVASHDAQRGSLRIHQDALMCSAMLEPGQHVVHELLEGRIAWLHLVQGEAKLGDVVLTQGDGAGLTGERTVSLTAQSETEILLLDLGEPQPSPPENGGSS
jgi:redox-sensitive bicupin YhaK (pirin superfamily)